MFDYTLAQKGTKEQFEDTTLESLRQHEVNSGITSTFILK